MSHRGLVLVTALLWLRSRRGQQSCERTLGIARASVLPREMGRLDRFNKVAVPLDAAMTPQQLKDTIQASSSDRGVQLYSVSANPSAKPFTKLTISQTKLTALETCTAKCGNDDRDVFEGCMAPAPATSPTTVAGIWKQAACQRLSPAAAEELIQRVGVRPQYSPDLVLAGVDNLKGTLFDKKVPAVARDSKGELDWGPEDEVSLPSQKPLLPVHLNMTHDAQCRTFARPPPATSPLHPRP